jgi:hypothetical protein
MIPHARRSTTPVSAAAGAFFPVTLTFDAAPARIFTWAKRTMCPPASAGAVVPPLA